MAADRWKRFRECTVGRGESRRMAASAASSHCRATLGTGSVVVVVLEVVEVVVVVVEVVVVVVVVEVSVVDVVVVLEVAGGHAQVAEHG
jgi:hypothetical protein